MLHLLAESEFPTPDVYSNGGGGVPGIIMLIYLAVAILVIVAMWKVFTKAGQPGWASIIPIYNLFVMLQIAGKPGWWILLFLIPGVNLVIAILMYIAFAEKFGKGAGFGIGLTFLSFIFLPILAFSDAKYTD